MTPMTRVASKARFSASVWPEMRIARACSTRGGFSTATVRSGRAGFSVSTFLASASGAALPTEENLPVPIHAANPISTRTAASLWYLNFDIIAFRSPA